MVKVVITMYMGTVMYGNKRVWAQMCLGIDVSGHKHVWEQTCLGTNMPGYRRVGTSMYGHSPVVSMINTFLWQKWMIWILTTCGPRRMALFPYSTGRSSSEI